MRLVKTDGIVTFSFGQVPVRLSAADTLYAVVTT